MPKTSSNRYKIGDYVIPDNISPLGTMVVMTKIESNYTFSRGIRLDNNNEVTFIIEESKGPFTKSKNPEMFI